MNPGDPRVQFMRLRRPVSPLNEGRGVNPGDPAGDRVVLGLVDRSTKAGA